MPTSSHVACVDLAEGAHSLAKRISASNGSRTPTSRMEAKFDNHYTTAITLNDEINKERLLVHPNKLSTAMK